MSYEDTRLSTAVTGIKQLKGTVVSEIENLEDVDKQLGTIAVIVNNFVMQTLQVVSGNEDITSVNEQLANSLIQIRDFVVNRPAEIKQTIQRLENRLDAYDQCQLVLNEASKIEMPKNPNKEEQEQTNDTRKKKKTAIEEQLDSEGKYNLRRKPGTRPEKLKDIRNVEAEVKAQKNSEEDI